MEKSGQAAMEFLMTYGWAILAAVIAIGVLAYFGVFSPGSVVSNSIMVNAPFGATQEMTLKTDAITFVLRNGAGDSVTLINVTVEGCGTDTTGQTIADGDSDTISVTCSPALTSGDKFSGDIEIYYNTGEELLDIVSSGSIRGKVE